MKGNDILKLYRSCDKLFTDFQALSELLERLGIGDRVCGHQHIPAVREQDLHTHVNTARGYIGAVRGYIMHDMDMTVGVFGKMIINEEVGE